MSSRARPSGSVITGSGRLRGAAAVVLAAGLCVLAACAVQRRAPAAADLMAAHRWWILIGHSADLAGIDWRVQTAGVQMVVMNGGPGLRLDRVRQETIRLGYLSVGEADSHRDYWPSVQHAAYLVETNPQWPENVRVDLRDPGWRQIVLEQEAPRLLKLGFQGFMLDTLDTAPYLERKDPARFAGSRQALRDLLAELRRRFPQVMVVANGTESLVDAAPYVDGYVVEGVFATYDFGGWMYRQTTEEERAWKLAQVENALAIAHRPVFSVEYAGPEDTQLAAWAADESRRHGFRPYVTVKDLNQLPVR